MCKKLFVLISFVLVAGLIGTARVSAEEIDIRITDGADDVEERIGSNNGAMDIASSDLEFPYEDPEQVDPQILGMRFVNIPISQGKQVLDAYIEFEVDETKSGTLPVNVLISGQLAPNAEAFANTASNISNRSALTMAVVPWTVDDWTANNQKSRTANIAAIIQEIVNQPDWVSGNAIVIIIKDDPANPSTGVRCAESVEGEATAAPLLHISLASEIDIRITDGADDVEERIGSNNGAMDIASSDLEFPYEDPEQVDPQILGMRFVNIPISQGKQVLDAYIEFEVDETKSGTLPVNVLISGQLAANAEPFANTASNISNRAAFTTAVVPWTVDDWTANNQKSRTANIAPIIQEIVNQPDWVSGNAIVIIIKDDPANPSTGVRCAESVEGEATAAPLLHLTAELSIVETASEPNPADGAAGVSYLPNLNTYFSSDVPKNIPDYSAGVGKNIVGEVTSTLSVPDSIKITDLNIELDIRKPGNNADLDVYLKSPDGKEIELFTDIGLHSADDFKNTILDDEASTSIRDGTGNFTGSYKPEGKLSDFDGRTANGTWRLKVQDDWYGDPGTLNSWRLVIESPALLKWTPPGGAASQDVYFSVNFEDVNSSAASAFLGNVAADAASIGVGPLARGQTYFWRVDTHTPDGRLGLGDIWSFTTAPGNVAIDQQVLASNDDGEDHIAYGTKADDGAESLTSSDLEMPWDGTIGSGKYQIVGLRFENMALPKDLAISGAYVQFTADNEKLTGGPVNLIINGLLQPDTNEFASGENFSERGPKTSVQVSWTDIPTWTSVTANLASRTPDISDIVKEIIGQDGWTPGNALMFFIRDDETNPSKSVRSAESFDNSPAQAPRFHVDGVTEAALAPSPADGAVEVVQNVTLSWAPGFSAVSRDVYFGTSSSPAKLERTTGTSFKLPKLATSTTYYWRIDEIEADGTKHTGVVWSFTTIIGEATEPNPFDHAAGVALDATLSWKAGATAATHDVYFGTTDSPEFKGNQAETTYTPVGLAKGGVYYWRIDEIETDGTKHVGNIWTFKTIRDGTGTILREVWENIGSGTKVSDLTSNPNYPANPSYKDELMMFEAPIDFADNFGSRIHGWLHPDTSGDYTFWIASDDNSELWLSTDEKPANAVLISKVTDWADPRQFDDSDVVPSGPIHLEAGHKYYIMALYKEGGGGDNCAVAWEGPDNPVRAVINGYYLTPFVALWADSPDPANGAVIQQTWVMLSWTAGVTAVSHNVYIGTAPDALEKQVNQTATILTVGLPGLPLPDGLVPGTTYYWRIDEVEADPNIVHEGAVWSFSVPPATAYNPNPADGATGVATNVVLHWTAGLGAKLHSVYFGDNLDTVTSAVGAPPLPVTTFNPGPLQPGKTYYWRVDEFNPPKTVKGKVWSFTTVEPPPPPAL